MNAGGESVAGQRSGRRLRGRGRRAPAACTAAAAGMMLWRKARRALHERRPRGPSEGSLTEPVSWFPPRCSLHRRRCWQLLRGLWRTGLDARCCLSLARRRPTPLTPPSSVRFVTQVLTGVPGYSDTFRAHVCATLRVTLWCRANSSSLGCAQTTGVARGVIMPVCPLSSLLPRIYSRLRGPRRCHLHSSRSFRPSACMSL